ncbi:spermatogenesis-associated protein 1 isoform X2 [Ursus arctos]|uniref:spermatogenesis-associated protein 1 isoform X2 n=1 Tax=Ursus arctos TaxID=9644 RepID=UPI002016F9A4|nr:spermatogenesis-associated protein 1 isoform X2 [Ursus arctos]
MALSRAGQIRPCVDPSVRGSAGPDGGAARRGAGLGTLSLKFPVLCPAAPPAARMRAPPPRSVPAPHPRGERSGGRGSREREGVERSACRVTAGRERDWTPIFFLSREADLEELVELHVFYVPEGSWNYKLNTISIDVVNKFISAGFIRVSPHLTLQALRERLGEFLGEDAVAEKFLFLKCIGNNLAVVKVKQESELKLKSFAPPYALQPELYLLPIMDHLGNIYSASTVSLNGRQTNNGVAEADGIIHRPLSVTSLKEEPGPDPSFLVNTLKELLNKNQEEATSAAGKATPKENQPGKNQIGNSEVPGSLEESNTDYFSNKKSQFLWKNEDDGVSIIRTEDNQIGKKECITLPDLIDFPSLPCQPALSPGVTDLSFLQIEREKIIEQMKQVKEERRFLERIREELIKKIEKLFEQSKLKRYHACDGWKRKYFETKKITASLEEVLTKLREDLELYYKKLLMQLEAREIKMRPKNLANITDSKNYLIIQITEVQHAIDQLKRKLDTDKMKLIIEVKMRKQAVSDLRTLKAELAQKKINTSLQSQLVPGNVPS